MVVGAGPGGLFTALLLAQRGFHVDVSNLAQLYNVKVIKLWYTQQAAPYSIAACPLITWMNGFISYHSAIGDEGVPYPPESNPLSLL